jgi:hypothetical protein
VPTGPDDNGHVGDGEPGLTFRQRLSGLFLKAPPPGSEPAPVAPPRTLEELEDAERYADDKERMIGLVAAPVAAFLTILLANSESRNEAAHWTHSLYAEFVIVLLGLAVIMLAAAWFRKRLYMGVAMALYGLALFNLRWWGFGFPYILVGSWLLVRAYRAQKAVKLATGETGDRGGSGSVGSSGPRASKRYTPPTAKPKRTTKPEGEQKAG